MTPLDRDLIERARQADILEVAQRYRAKLSRIGSGEYSGPCPVCGGRDRFSVNTRKRLWNCRGCDKGGDVLEIVRHISGSTFPEAVEALAGKAWTPTAPLSHRRRPDHKDHGWNGRCAAHIWDVARSIRGTLAERYLVQGRGVDIEQIPDIDDVLRFEVSCPFGGDTLPCLVALVRDVVTDAAKAIVRTALSGDARKIDRFALGPTKGGAIKLWPDSYVTSGLVVGEGLETTAAAATRIEHRGTLLQPAWALINRINLRDVKILSGVEALTILVDNDESGDGQAAAKVCARQWLDAGCEVVRLTPKILGADFNDIVQRESAA